MIRKKCTNLVSAAVLGLTALTATPPTQAGLVWFSRANCVNNESISWDEGGRIIEEVLWVSEQKLHMLTFAPDMEPGRYGLTKSNFRLSAVSLAQELR
jgi:hypothetical protein